MTKVVTAASRKLAVLQVRCHASRLIPSNLIGHGGHVRLALTKIIRCCLSKLRENST